MHRVTDCKASEDYRFWFRFEYGVEGSVFLGKFLEIGSFRAWRDVDRFAGFLSAKLQQQLSGKRVSGWIRISSTRTCSQ